MGALVLSNRFEFIAGRTAPSVTGSILVQLMFEAGGLRIVKQAASCHSGGLVRDGLLRFIRLGARGGGERAGGGGRPGPGPRGAPGGGPGRGPGGGPGGRPGKKGFPGVLWIAGPCRSARRASRSREPPGHPFHSGQPLCPCKPSLQLNLVVPPNRPGWRDPVAKPGRARATTCIICG